MTIPKTNIELNKAYNIDCLELMKQLPDNCIDLVLTDPPYGIGISNNPVRQKHKKKKWDNRIPEKEIFDEIFRISKNQIIWGGNYFTLPKTQCFLIWDKKQPENFSLAMAEYAYTNFNSPAKIFRKSVLEEKGKIHPTQKPLKLFKWCLEKYATPIIEKQNIDPKDFIVADFFAGSFTTGLACHDYGFSYILTEKDKDYFQDGSKRLDNHKRQGLLEF